MTQAPIRVVLADDQAMVRGALAALLSLEGDIEVVGQADDVTSAIELARKHTPDVLLMDVQMPGTDDTPDGIAAVERVKVQSPTTHVMVVTTFGRPGYLQRAMGAGARGFMVKDAPVDKLVDAIRRVCGGMLVVDPDLAAQSLSVGTSPLSQRETEVLEAAMRGGDTGDIASLVHLSAGTVRNHLSSAIGKLGAANRAEAVRIATDAGWI